MAPAKKQRNRASTLFAITIPRCDYGRQFLYSHLKDCAEALVVSQETHEDGAPHLHVYLRSREKWLLADLREYVLELLSSVSDEPYAGACDIQKLRREANWLRYITKEDTEPILYNVSSSQCHQSYRIFRLISCGPVLSRYHSFFRAQPHLLPRVMEMHTEYWGDQSRIESIDFRVIPDLRAIWCRQAIGALSRGEHLYLHGGAGLGKSVLVNAYIKARKLYPPYVAYLPCGTTEFEFSSVRPVTTIILASDAPDSYIQLHRSRLLTLCDRGFVSINVKCAPIAQFRSSAQVVIVSNYPIPEDAAVERRFTQVHASTKAIQLWTSEDFQAHCEAFKAAIQSDRLVQGVHEGTSSS